MTKSTEQILERIRELVPELKELKFGCELKGKNREATIINLPAIEGNPYTIKVGGLITTGNPSDLEIIGLPIELNHLLLVLTKNSKQFCNLVSNVEDGTGIVVDGVFAPYDLSLSVEENLQENEDLRNLISELIFLQNKSI